MVVIWSGTLFLQVILFKGINSANMLNTSLLVNESDSVSQRQGRPVDWILDFLSRKIAQEKGTLVIFDSENTTSSRKKDVVQTFDESTENFVDSETELVLVLILPALILLYCAAGITYCVCKCRKTLKQPKQRKIIITKQAVATYSIQTTMGNTSGSVIQVKENDKTSQMNQDDDKHLNQEGKIKINLNSKNENPNQDLNKVQVTVEENEKPGKTPPSEVQKLNASPETKTVIEKSLEMNQSSQVPRRIANSQPALKKKLSTRSLVSSSSVESVSKQGALTVIRGKKLAETNGSQSKSNSQTNINKWDQKAKKQDGLRPWKTGNPIFPVKQLPSDKDEDSLIHLYRTTKLPRPKKYVYCSST